MAASFQAAVVDVLTNRIMRAAKQIGVRRLAISGGVAANSALRAAVMDLGLDCTLPPKSRCTDNAAMIACAGWARRAEGRRATQALFTTPRWPLAELQPPGTTPKLDWA